METKNVQEANKEIIRKYFKTIDEEGKTGNAKILDDFLSAGKLEEGKIDRCQIKIRARRSTHDLGKSALRRLALC